MNPYIAVDFAKTLVKEHPMIKWVLFELRNSEVSLLRRLKFLFSSFIRGSLSIVFGRFKATSEWAARAAYMNFRGLSERSLERIICILNLNLDVVDVLSALKREYCLDPAQSMGFSIHSQGTCVRAIEMFRDRQDVAEALSQAGLYIHSIVANQMEIIDGKFTGQILGTVITRHSKPNTIPKGSIFVGDSHDEKIVSKIKDRDFEFIKPLKKA